MVLLIGAAGMRTQAGTVDLSATPPELTPAVAPNIILTYDDSNSMRKTFVPGYLDGDIAYGAYSGFITDPITGGRMCGWYSADASKVVHPWNFSPAVNTIYYDEQLTYVAPKHPDGSAMDPGSFTAAWEDGIAANTGGTRAVRNLLTDYAIYWWGGNTIQPEAIYPASKSHPASMQCKVDDGYMPFPFADPDGNNAHAFFYRFLGDRASRRDLFDPRKYVAVDVSTLSDAQKKNFTIWYGFYRTRNQAARSALARALESVPRTIRVQWQRLTTGPLDNTAIIRPLTDETQFRKLMDFVYASQPSGGTPTRGAMTRVANYFSRSNTALSENNPYYDVASGRELSCRRNYSLLVTDGGWNENAGFTRDWSDATGAKGNVAVAPNPDQTITTLPDGRKYDPNSAAATIYGGGPSQRNLSGFADVAFHYWATDLRPDLKNDVVPYLPDRTTGITGASISTPMGSDPASLPDEVYFNPANDPATWQHLVQFVVTFGLDGVLDFPGDLTALRKGTKTWSDWASPPNDELLDTAAKTDDTWHAAINSRGELFNANNPQQLIDQIRQVINSIVARTGSSAAGAISHTVLGTDSTYFRTGFSSDDWSGVVQAVRVDESGNLGASRWNAGALLDARTGNADDRVILTSTAPGASHGAAFRGASVLEALHAVDAGFETGAAGNDRLDWIRGVRTKEGSAFRQRSSVLGAVVNAQAVYVAYPASGYRDTFPSRRSRPGEPAPEMAVGKDGRLLHSYEQFVADHLKRAPTLYVGANDGMLHAFDATTDGVDPASVDSAPKPGAERWAYVPYSVYGGLRGMSALTHFQYAPTVDGTPVVRDVYFSSGPLVGWHSILVAGVRFGGRGIYALDITDAGANEATGPSEKVLWEFHHTSASMAGDPSNLGYTFGRPNIGRLANGRWVVLVPSGYFPTGSTEPAAARHVSSLFVLDAQTGTLLKELRTPTLVAGMGITSDGLTSPVLGDYEGDQVDDVAFAGDLQGNVWRFDLSDEDASNWKVDLLFKPAVAGQRPVTVMPRLFPDPATRHFIVLFGTGKYLGSSDNLVDATTQVQAVYGIRDPGTSRAMPVIEGTTPMVQQQLYEKGDVRGLTTHAVPLKDGAGNPVGGWYFLLQTTGVDGKQSNAGERVVVDATALFDSNRAIVTTLIPQKSDPCNPTTQGAVLVVDAATGGAASGVQLGPVGGWDDAYAHAGARITNAPTGGSLPAAIRVGGGQVYLPGITLSSDGSPFSVGDAIWRRRSWRALNNDQ
ncbi:pilus assembly protein [Dyella jiangningensis]|nr:PilC/PilY family type IV pilus protein [Dyella jiangningensis]